MTKRLTLLVRTSDPFERALLGSVRCDQPPPHAIQRAAAALGLGTTAFLSTGVVAGAQSFAATSLRLVAFKAIGIGFVAGGMLVAGASTVSSLQPGDQSQVRTGPSGALDSFAPGVTTGLRIEEIALPPAPPTVPTALAVDGHAPRRSPASPSNSANAKKPEDAREREVASAPKPLIAPTAAPRGVQWMNTAPPAQASSMGEEIAVIDRARLALRSGDARSAMTELDSYDRRWPSGAFGMEASILRIEARLLLGDRAAAERDANAIISRQPNNRYSARLRELIGRAR